MGRIDSTAIKTVNRMTREHRARKISRAAIFTSMRYELLCLDCVPVQCNSVTSLNRTPLGPKKRFSLERFSD